MVVWVFLAGVPVRSSLVLLLATLVDHPNLVVKHKGGVERDVIVIGLDEDEQATVLEALADPPPGLEDVRNALLAERSWRARVEDSRAESTAA